MSYCFPFFAYFFHVFSNSINPELDALQLVNFAQNEIYHEYPLDVSLRSIAVADLNNDSIDDCFD